MGSKVAFKGCLSKGQLVPPPSFQEDEGSITALLCLQQFCCLVSLSLEYCFCFFSLSLQKEQEFAQVLEKQEQTKLWADKAKKFHSKK